MKDRIYLLNTLGVRYSNDPERYLGLPNLMGRSKKKGVSIVEGSFKTED